MQGIRTARVNWQSRLLNKNEIKNLENKAFIGTEFLISKEEQVLPLYGISIKRCEYLIIWRDYNFNKNNPNNYKNEQFQEMLKFNENIKIFASREVDSKVYYIKTSEEALKLIKKKKFNKIILITNASNEAEQYIDNARKIINTDCFVLVSSIYPYQHLDWVSKMKNVFISHKTEFHQRFIKSVILFDLEELIKLKEDIEKFYGQKYPNFKLNIDEEFPVYPFFINDGTFEQIKF